MFEPSINFLGNDDNVYIFSDGKTVASGDMPFGLDPVYLNDYWISWNNGKNLHPIDVILEMSIPVFPLLESVDSMESHLLLMWRKYKQVWYNDSMWSNCSIPHALI